MVDHFIFIMRNTLNPTCLERCLDAVVAVLHAEQQQLQQQGERPEAPCPTTQASILASQFLGAGLLESLVQVQPSKHDMGAWGGGQDCLISHPVRLRLVH